MQKFLPIAPLVLAAILAIAASTQAADPAKPADDEISSLSDIVAGLPHDIQVGLMNNTTKDNAAANATEFLHKSVAGKMATLKLKINTMGRDLKADSTKDAYKIQAVNEHTRVGGVTFRDILWIHFNMSENAKVAVMKKGADITVIGKVTLTEITVPPRSLDLHVDLSDAVVK